MANGMGSLYIGVSGLHSAQTALNTTAHISGPEAGDETHYL